MTAWGIPDRQALELIGFPGKVGKSGTRPRFRLNTKQTRLVSYLQEIQAALAAVDRDAAWLHRRIRTKPCLGQSPLTHMIQGGETAMADVLRMLSRDSLRASLT